MRDIEDPSQAEPAAVFAPQTADDVMAPAAIATALREELPHVFSTSDRVMPGIGRVLGELHLCDTNRWSWSK